MKIIRYNKQFYLHQFSLYFSIPNTYWYDTEVHNFTFFLPNDIHFNNKLDDLECEISLEHKY